ncbi:unnamed protein product [Dovyalis caffra]|uniref:Sodium/calcium exchanger membrane region domain-containing protein n=1 Tax=Dovyalis caffra TaxID=77055 RepID=A0AAV1S0X8_9ROSI|nr:unnamed protein product [Dovyalis caffra]
MLLRVRLSAPCSMLLRILEMPLSLPGRLTSSVVCEKRWSKPTAVASMTLAPVLLSTLWNAQDDSATFNKSLMVYGIGLMFGMTFGVLAYATTEKSSPPRRLTVLARGNSIGDLITNLILAANGSPEGTQVAISSRYASPIFNILFGPGLSPVCSARYSYPSLL